MRIYLRITLTAAMAAGLAAADVTFDQMVRFTGGSMVEMIRRMANNPMISRKGGGAASAFQDQKFTVYIKGSKMARIGQATSTITDADAGTVTVINNERRTYMTQTFDEIRQRMEQAQQRMHQQGGNLQFDVKTDTTGQTRTIDGKSAGEVVLTLTAQSSSANGQMIVKVHSWLIAADAAMQEARDFYKRLGQKFSYAFGGSPALGPAAGGISAAYREMMNLDGYPILSEIAVTGVASPMAMVGGGDPNAPLIKTETESSKFVSGPVDDSKFAVPAGYTQEQLGGARLPQ